MHLKLNENSDIMSSKRITIISAAILLAVSLFCFSSCKQKQSNIVRIGVVSPMTGAGAACVQYWVNGFNMAIEELNESQSDYKYEVVFEDCQSDPATAVSCYKRLEMQGIKYVVGLGGQFAMAIAPLTKGKDMVYFTTADYNEAVLDITDCGFRVYPSAKNFGRTAADFLIDSCGVTNFATITMNTVPCINSTEAFSARSSEKGGRINFQDKYDIGAYDFKNTVAKMSGTPVDAVFINGFGISPASFCSQMASVAKFNDTIVFGDVNLSTQAFLDNKKNETASIYYADADCSREFETTYVEKYNTVCNSYVSCAYLIPYIVDSARRSVENADDYAAQRDYLKNNTITNLASDITFDSKGNGEMVMSVHKIQ